MKILEGMREDHVHTFTPAGEWDIRGLHRELRACVCNVVEGRWDGGEWAALRASR